MLGITDLKNGVVIDLDGAPYEVVKYQHSKMGRGGAVMRTTLKNLLTGNNIERTFHGDEKFESADMRQGKVQFLYKEADQYLFMDNQTFEQFPISRNVIGHDANFLLEGSEVGVIYYKDRPIKIALPLKMRFKVIEAEPAVKGDTVTNPSKNIVIETGYQLKAPMFVNTGEYIMVDTRDGSYIERTK